MSKFQPIVELQAHEGIEESCGNIPIGNYFVSFVLFVVKLIVAGRGGYGKRR